jgi:hypothetical protein
MFKTVVDNLSTSWEEAGRTHLVDKLLEQHCYKSYTRKNAQVITGLQTSCYKSVQKLSTSCVSTACSKLF